METGQRLQPGLDSGALRGLTPPRIISLCVQSGLPCIEWGGDIHVPHGDINTAKRVAVFSRDAGVAVASYGSYYRVGSSGRDSTDFEIILATALALGAPEIRVRAGTRSSGTSDEAYFNWVADELCRISGLADAAGIRLVCEYRSATLADSISACGRLLNKTAHPNVSLAWQPAESGPPRQEQTVLTSLLPRLTRVYVFQRQTPEGEVQVLAEGEVHWRQYIDILRSDGSARCCFLKFFREDDPARLAADAATLKDWLSRL